MISSLKCFYTNIRSIKNKLDLICVDMASSRYDIVMITETWLNAETPNSELFMPGYDIIRRDRERRTHGGILVYIRNSLVYETVSANNHYGVDVEVVELIIHGPYGIHLPIAVVYRPPGHSETQDNQLIERLQRYAQKATFLLLGTSTHHKLTGSG